MVFLALHYADFWGNRRPFPSKVKNNFSRIDISQPTPSLSLSVPLFSLGMTYYPKWSLIMVMAEKTPTFVTSPRIFALKRDQIR